MHTLIVMDRSGDTRHNFDANDEAAVAAAEQRGEDGIRCNAHGLRNGQTIPLILKFQNPGKHVIWEAAQQIDAQTRYLGPLIPATCTDQPQNLPAIDATGT